MACATAIAMGLLGFSFVSSLLGEVPVKQAFAIAAAR